MKSNFEPVKDLNFTRRKLPHYQSTRTCYFVTSHCSMGVILSPEERDIVLSAIKFLDDKKYDLLTAVVMPDHIHLLIIPHPKNDDSEFSLSEIMHSIKSYTAHQCKRKIWQHESFDKTVRNNDEFVTFASYIFNNPMKKGLVAEGEDYKWFYVFNNKLEYI
ncbi:MAG: transposase [Ignavibacteria bacterium]|nr:transposase [Ignavibacteria bacterium]